MSLRKTGHIEKRWDISEFSTFFAMRHREPMDIHIIQSMVTDFHPLADNLAGVLDTPVQPFFSLQ